jgi:glycosyltransferase involved in cell wall biosynthesis
MVESLGHGGCERDAAKIALGIDRTRFEPHVAAFYPDGYRARELRDAGIPILSLPVRSFLNSSAWHAARRLGAYLREHRIRLIHAFDVPLDLFGAPVARCCRVPVVITSQLSYRNMYPRVRRVALRVTDWLADRVVVNSRAVGDSLRAAGLSADRLYLCYNGVNPAEFSPGPGVRPPVLKNCSLIVGAVCVMRPEKRIDWVMRAFAEVSRASPGLGLLLVGSGPELPALTALRDSLGLQSVCHLEPSRPDVAGWMRGIDIFINASSSESFPNALLEAMACGCCVIGSKVGGIPELVTHGQDGLVFESTDPAQLAGMLQLAVTDAGLRQKVRAQAVETAHHRFSMRITLDRTESLYMELLRRRGVAPQESALTAC